MLKMILKFLPKGTFVLFLSISLVTSEVIDLNMSEANRSLLSPSSPFAPGEMTLRRNPKGQTDRHSRFPRHTDPDTEYKPLYCPNNSATIPNNRPLLCYQCKGEARQKDSICDNTLWHFARKTEQYKVRIRCPNDRGFYCVKVIQEKEGIRLTDRGCLGRGPVRVLGGKVVPLNDGCVVYRQNGYITTSCLCRKDLCNSTPHGRWKFSKPRLILSLALLILLEKFI